MSKECDVFSDSYGCVITKSIGYQSPFPLVRLGNGVGGVRGDGPHLQGACFASSLNAQSASRGRLVSLDFSVGDSCVSFLQLMDAAKKPLVLDKNVQYVKKVEATAGASVVVTRSEGNSWNASAYSWEEAEGDGKCVRVLFRNMFSASLREGVVWALEALASDSHQPRMLHHRALDVAFAGGPSSSTALAGGTGRPLDVVALTTDTAVVLSTGGVALADRRQRAAPLLVKTPLTNGGVAEGGRLLSFGDDHVLRVWDSRNPSTSMFASSTASYLSIKSALSTSTALLVTGDATAVFDVSALAVTATLQHSGDTVLDAALLPGAPGSTRVCTSTGSGMLYDWVVTA